MAELVNATVYAAVTGGRPTLGLTPGGDGSVSMAELVNATVYAAVTGGRPTLGLTPGGDGSAN